MNSMIILIVIVYIYRPLIKCNVIDGDEVITKNNDVFGLPEIY